MLVPSRYYQNIRVAKYAPVGKPELGLERVEVGLELGLLLHPGWLVLPPVLPVLLQLFLNGHQGVSGLTALKPWQCPANPLEQL